MRLEQDPIHRHKDVLAHTIAVVENVRPDAPGSFRRTGWPRCSTTWASPAPVSKGKGVTFHHHEVVGAVARERMQALDATDDVEAVTRSSSCTCGSTPTTWAGPTR